MAQSYKKGRKFKTESPALLPITCGDRPAAASRTPVSIPPLCPRHYPRLCAAVGIRSPCPSRTPFRAVIGSCSLCRSPHTSLCRCSHTSLCCRPHTSLCFCQHPHLCFAVGIRFPHLRSHPRLCVAVGNCSLCRRPYTSLCLCQHPHLCFAVGIRFPHLRPIPASVPPSAFRLWIVVGVRFLRRGKRGRAVPDKIGVVEILLKNRAPRGWNPANNS